MGVLQFISWVLIYESPDSHSLTILVYNLCILLSGTCPKWAQFTIPVHFLPAKNVLDSLKKPVLIYSDAVKGEMYVQSRTASCTFL